MGDLLQYRFDTYERSLTGHAMGNLLIAAMCAIDGGDFEAAVREMNRVVAVRGSVVPASGTALTLHARLRDGGEVIGQSRIMRMRGIERVWLEPADVRASRDAVRAIAEADLVVLGPGSLYTSLLATVLVPELRAALATTPALHPGRDVSHQEGETEGYDLADHVEALAVHGIADLLDVVLRTVTSAGRDRMASSACRSSCAGPRWVLPARRASSSTTSWTPRTPTTTIRRAGRRRAAPLRARGGQPSRRDRPDRVVGGHGDRALVTALRAELAAIQPPRACDRTAEVAGSGRRRSAATGPRSAGSSSVCSATAWHRPRPSPGTARRTTVGGWLRAGAGVPSPWPTAACI